MAGSVQISAAFFAHINYFENFEFEQCHPAILESATNSNQTHLVSRNGRSGGERGIRTGSEIFNADGFLKDAELKVMNLKPGCTSTPVRKAGANGSMCWEEVGIKLKLVLISYSVGASSA